MDLHPVITALAPELILIVAGSLLLLLGLSSRRASIGLVEFLSLVAVAAALGITALLRASPPESTPSIRVDALVWYTRLIGLSVGAVIILVNRHVADPPQRGEFLALLLYSLAGLLTAALADDLILFFLALELVSIPTYVLVGLSRTDARAQEAAGKYFFLGAFAAALMLYGFSFLYGAAGTTTMFGTAPAGTTGQPSVAAVLSAGAAAARPDLLVTIGLLLAVAGMAFKIAAVPLHFYVPDVYQGAASPITGMLGFVPKFAGMIGLIRLLALTGWQLSTPLFWTLWIVAVLTMTTGNTLALMQQNAKRMLAYSSIAHSGYMLIALLAGPAAAHETIEAPTRNGTAALLFYMAVYGLMNLGAFAALAYIRRPDADQPVGAEPRGQPAEDLEDLGGASQRHPWASLALAICVLSLLGIPPTAGFLGKFYIFSSAFAAAGSSPYGAALVALVIIGLVNAAIAAAYYMRIVATCYLRPAAGPAAATNCDALRTGLAICAVAMLVLFVFPGTIVREASDAAAAQRAGRPTVRADEPRDDFDELSAVPRRPDFEPTTEALRE